MQFLVMVKGVEKAGEAYDAPSVDDEDFKRMGRFNDELEKAGAIVNLGGLKATTFGARIKWNAGKPTVIDGPFAETKELVAGFWILNFASLDEAKQWIARAPFGNETIEIRPLYGDEDYPEPSA